MPFKSEKQRKFFWMKHPKIAQRWTREYGSVIDFAIKEHKKRKKKKK